MASSDKLNFNGLVTGNKVFKIPPYQRNFAWDKEQREDLWEDLTEAIEMDRDHYIGAFLLMKDQKDGMEVREIIDGQQRTTTLLILLFELQRQLEKHGEEDTAERIISQFITNVGQQKLALLGDDKDFFKNTILEGVTDRDKTGKREDALSKADDSSPSKKRLLETKEDFREWLDDAPPEELEHNDPVEFYKDLYDKIKNLPLLQYPVESRSEAARIFQTVNDRGKDLTDLEITKSYLIHRTSLITNENTDTHIEKIQRDFSSIYDSVEDIETGASEDQIQRYHFIMWHPGWTTGRDKRYYQNHLDHVKQVYRKTTDVDEILQYSNELDSMFDRLAEMSNYEEIDSERIKERLKRLFVAGRLANFHPLMMAAYDQYKKDEISEDQLCKLLDKIETFIVRTYIIKQKNADTGRTKAYPLARQLYYSQKETVPENIDPKTVDEVIGELEEHINYYCDDEGLIDTLANEEVYEYYNGSSRLNELRLLLYTYETSLEHEEEDIPFDADRVTRNKKGRFSVEHIWPQTPLDGISEEKEEKINEHKHRLGNLALMTPEDNSANQNDLFKDKKDGFQGSKFRMLEDIFNREVWGENWGVKQIDDREGAMIQVIKDRWPDEYSE